MSPWASGDSLTPSTLNRVVPSWVSNVGVYHADQQGLVGDGTTDDTAALRTLLSALSASGGVVRFSAKTYRLTSAFTVWTRTMLQGAGRQATVLSNGSSTKGCDVFTDAAIRDLTLRGAGTSNSAAIGINSGDAHRVQIENSIIERWGWHGINTGGGCTEWAVVGNAIRDNAQGGLLTGAANSPSLRFLVSGNWVSGNSTNGLDFNGSKHIIVGNHVASNGTDSANGFDQWGILLQALAGADASECVIANNRVESNMQHGIILRSWAGQNCSRNVVIGNVCHSNGSATALTGYGIVVDGTGGGNLDFNLITGNDCSLNDGHGIGLDGSGSSQARENVVTGNVCISNGSAGIGLSGTSLFDAVVTNNVALRNTNSQITRAPNAAPTRAKIAWNSTSTADTALEAENATVRIGGPANETKRLDIYGYANATGSGVYHSIYGDAASNTNLLIQPIGGSVFTAEGVTGTLHGAVHRAARFVSDTTLAASATTSSIATQGMFGFSVLSTTSNGAEFFLRSGNSVFRFASVAVG